MTTADNLYHNDSRFRFLRHSLKAGASLAAVGTLLAAMPSFAQDNATTTAIDGAASDQGDPDEIVVTGLRASLASSQNIKRDSDTVVDAITAEDIGALPDRSVTEALQRVPGVQINRFAGSNDPDHFSVEGAGVVIRGLNFVRGEFNGRDAFSANGGRQLGFADVPAELMGSVIVAKNVTAEMIEGGLAGTVNLNTRVPFDKNGLFWGGTLEVNYSDLIEKFSPQGSLLVSNTWDTGAGRFGLLGAVSYSQVLSRSDGIQVTNFQTRDGATVAGSNGSGDVVRTQIPGFDVVYAPLGGQFRTQDYNRQRYGYSAAAQWESLDETMLATFQFFRADSTNSWGEHTFESGPDLAEYNTFPAAGTTYEVDENNVFESGYITLPGTGWRTGGDSGNGGGRVSTGGVQQSLSRRQVYQETTNQDFGFNFRYTPNEQWAFNFDAQYTEASTNNLDFSVFGSTFADTQLDLTGNLPVVIPTKPQNTRATWAGPNEMDGLTDQEYFSSNRYTFWRAAMDHAEDSDGHEYAFKGDAQYSFPDDSFLKRFKVGGRYTDRDQTVRYTSYNWGRLSEVWAGNAGSAVFFDEFGGEGTTEFFEFPNFFRGATPGPVGGWYFAGDLINDYQESAGFFQQIEEYFRIGQDGPADGQDQGWRPLAQRAGAISGTPFTPADIQVVSESSLAGYAMLSFGNDEFADYPTISGNVGFRYVDTKLDSAGSVSYGNSNGTTVGNGSAFAVTCDPTPEVPDGAPPGTPPVAPDLPAECDLGEAGYNDAQDFADGTASEDIARNSYGNFLPSLNLRLELNPELQIRFAASRTMARPDFAYTRNFVTIGTDSASGGFRFQANAGNPYLLPATADQFDLSGEWYFDAVGSLTVTGFYKSVKNFFYRDVSLRSFTNNGQTYDVAISGPANYSEDRGKIKGFELAYQQTYDFLPGFLSGLGFNGNYTFIKSKGIPNAEIGGIENPGQESNLQPGNLPLEQLSKHNFNATLFYEKGPISLRGAYNWRSRFLLTSQDVIFPYYPVYNAPTGQLDASIFYEITPGVKLAIQGTNLLNEVTKTEQQFTDDGLIGPRSYFVNDRRFSFGVRASF